MLPLCCLFTGTDGGIETDNILSFQWQLIVKSDGRDPVQQWSKKVGIVVFCQLLTWCEHYNRKTHSRLSCWTRNSAFSVETRSSASSGLYLYSYFINHKFDLFPWEFVLSTTSFFMRSVYQGDAWIIWQQAACNDCSLQKAIKSKHQKPRMKQQTLQN